MLGTKALLDQLFNRHSHTHRHSNGILNSPAPAAAAANSINYEVACERVEASCYLTSTEPKSVHETS